MKLLIKWLAILVLMDISVCLGTVPNVTMIDEKILVLSDAEDSEVIEARHDPLQKPSTAARSVRSGRQFNYEPQSQWSNSYSDGGSQCITSNGFLGSCMAYRECFSYVRHTNSIFFRHGWTPKKWLRDGEDDESCLFYDKYGRQVTGICCSGQRDERDEEEEEEEEDQADEDQAEEEVEQEEEEEDDEDHGNRPGFDHEFGHGTGHGTGNGFDQDAEDSYEQDNDHWFDQGTGDGFDQASINKPNNRPRPIERPIDRPIDRPNNRPRPTERPVDRPIDRPVDRPFNRPVSRPGERPIDRPISRPVDRPDRPIDRPVDRPFNRPVSRPGERPIDRPISRPVDRLDVSRPVERPVDRPINRPRPVERPRPIERPVERPMEKPIKRPIERPVERPPYRPIQRPIDRPTSRPINRPTSRPINRPGNAPVSRPIDKPFNGPISRPFDGPFQRPGSFGIGGIGGNHPPAHDDFAEDYYSENDFTPTGSVSGGAEDEQDEVEDDEYPTGSTGATGVGTSVGEEEEEHQNNVEYDPVEEPTQTGTGDYESQNWPSSLTHQSGPSNWPPPVPTHPPSTAQWPPPIPTHPPDHHYPTHPPSLRPIAAQTTRRSTSRPTYPTYAPPTKRTTSRPLRPTYRPTTTTTTTTTTHRPSYEPPLYCGIKNSVSADQERIVGGHNASPNEYPWIVVLFKGGKQFCGGSLIDNQHVLTAAHCVAKMTSWDVASLTANLGDHNIRTSFEVRHIERKIKRLVRHKGFEFSTLHNDIAVLTLDQPVTFSREIQPICLPGMPGSVIKSYSGQLATVAGWGSLRENGPQPSILQKVAVPIWVNSECAQKYGRAAPAGIIHSMMCAGQATRDSCSGDSGGPLILNDGGRWVQIGIVSWGIGCGKGQYPGVYTRVTSFLPWIAKNIK